ncbi:MAG TPA: PACE efflux transporter [Parvibaculum sp.]
MLRSTPERILQAAIYEAVGLALVTPAYAWAMGVTAGNSLATMTLVSVGVMIWSTIYNTVFDRALLRWTGRMAHERTWVHRALHAVLNEAIITLFAVPIIFIMSGRGWLAAFAADIGFTAAYVVYTYVFHLIYDRLRPIATGAQN